MLLTKYLSTTPEIVFTRLGIAMAVRRANAPKSKPRDDQAWMKGCHVEIIRHLCIIFWRRLKQERHESVTNCHGLKFRATACKLKKAFNRIKVI